MIYSKINRKARFSGGFTLLEILVVVIIVGVLASVAMPLLARNIERSRATEALAAMGIIRRAYLGCRAQENPGVGLTACDNWDILGMTDPGLSAGSHFTYSLSNGSGVYFMIATRNLVDGGDGGSDIVFNWQVANNGPVTKTGGGVFAGIQ
jgi:prepilin-type N-terminal cleavage/methylation domain-containing protein